MRFVATLVNEDNGNVATIYCTREEAMELAREAQGEGHSATVRDRETGETEQFPRLLGGRS